MAKEEVVRFIESASADETIRAQVEQAATPEEVARVAARNGFHFTGEQLEATRQEMRNRGAPALDELADAQLDQVTGGLGMLSSGATGSSMQDAYGRVKVQFQWERE